MTVLTAFLIAFLILFVYIIYTLAVGRQDELQKQEEIHQAKLEELNNSFSSRLSEETKKTLDKSRSVLRGNVTEELAPLLPGFKYDINDIKLLGSRPIDYIIFDGMSELRDNPDSGKLIEIVLADIKFNKSTLTPIQKAIQEAVQAKRIRFEEIVITRENKLKYKA